jgi:RND superfamily putative drug exporter
MKSILSPERLARTSARRPWLVVGIWIALVVFGFMLAQQMNLTDQSSSTNTESERAQDLLEERLRGPQPGVETVIIQSEGSTVDDPAFRAYAESLVADLRGLPESVASAANYYESGDEALVSNDRSILLIPVTLQGRIEDAMDTAEPVMVLVEERAASEQEFTTLIAGDGSIGHTWMDTAEEDLLAGEMIGIPVAIIILVLVFGAAVAAGVPLLIALMSIAVAMGLTAGISQVFELSTIVTNMITMIGLAVGIDYTLFVVERYREERAAGRSKLDAIATASSTAGRAVLFSGLTVIIALAGLMIVPATEFRSLSAGAIFVVAAAVAAALTLLPAMLSLLGDKINAWRLPWARKRTPGVESENGFWGRATRTVMAHPVLSVVGAGGILIALAVPFLTVEYGNNGVSTLPQDKEVVQGFMILDEEFSAGRLSPTEIAIDGDIDSPAVQGAVQQLTDSLAGDPGFGAITYTENQAGDLALLSVLVNGDFLDETAMDAVKRLRQDYIPAAFDDVDATVEVGGGTAQSIDGVETMEFYLPIVFAFVLGLSFILLMMVFRSIVLPLKAIVMNLLSVGAAYGAIVAVFQHGFLADFLGFTQTDTIEAWLPVFLFAVLFGLSMDYHVFLLSRIKERWDQTGDNDEAVSFGMRSTAHIITGAAAIMVVVFGAFAMGDVVALQQMGFGLAVAVFLDATIVRTVLVPASMKLLGRWNWYLPSWLEWLPRIEVEGHSTRQDERPRPPDLEFGPATGG